MHKSFSCVIKNQQDVWKSQLDMKSLSVIELNDSNWIYSSFTWCLQYKMAFGLSKNREKRYSKTYQDLIQYDKPKCIFSVVPHFDIPRFVLLHSMSTNCSERRSISLGLKNIMIYVITFLIMTGKKYKTSYNHINSKTRKTPKLCKNHQNVVTAKLYYLNV